MMAVSRGKSIGVYAYATLFFAFGCEYWWERSGKARLQRDCLTRLSKQ